MRVLVLSQHYWPESFRINAVTQDLVRAGHDVTVLTGQPNYPGGEIFDGYRAWSAGEDRHHDVSVYRVPLVPRGRGGARRLLANYLSFIVCACVGGAWMLRGRRFDVVFVYGTSPILQAIAGLAIARLKDCALVTWVQDLWPQSLEVTGYVRSPRLLAAVARVVRWIYAGNDMLLMQSRAFEPALRALAPARVPLRYHPNPGEPSPPGPASAGSGVPPALRLPAGFTIVFAGNLGTAQALEAVLDAAELTRADGDLSWVLIGSGQRGPWLAEQVRARSLHNVLLAGRYAPEAMPAILAQASALLVSLVPDPAMSLTVPSKLQTYLAMGRPIVAALDGEGARLIQEAGAGVCSPAGNAPALADAVRQLRRLSAAQREAMGARGRAYHASHFDPDRLTRALVDHLQAAIDHRHRAGDAIERQ